LGNGSWHRRQNEDGDWQIWTHKDECEPVKKVILEEESEKAKQEVEKKFSFITLECFTDFQ